MGMRKVGWISVIMGVFFLVSACGSIDTRATVEQLTNARVAVEAAEKMEAKTFAPTELRHAQDALAIAKDAYANEAFTRAFDFAKKATIYALVAKARTEQKKAEKKLAVLKDQLEKVKAQTEAYMTSSPLVTVTPQATGLPETETPVPTAVPATQEGTKP